MAAAKPARPTAALLAVLLGTLAAAGPASAQGVLRFDPGVYRVTMGDLGVAGPGGIVHVTARQASASSCSVVAWSEAGGNRRSRT